MHAIAEQRGIVKATRVVPNLLTEQRGIVKATRVVPNLLPRRKPLDLRLPRLEVCEFNELILEERRDHDPYRYAALLRIIEHASKRCIVVRMVWQVNASLPDLLQERGCHRSTMHAI